jgi:hypothetical protein
VDIPFPRFLKPVPISCPTVCDRLAAGEGAGPSGWT